MSYLSLARKYRPNIFADLVGQESVGLALGNAIRLKREPRGVIFTGVRGIGKTTTARIYAKALNCEKGSNPEPCNTCQSCLAIQQGIHEDVLEIDGASNTGVDDVRALQETLAYVPQRSSFKIYIIDEVHMLSVSAFNALLKTLEEPPEHVVFIFATTELHKVPETIQSRCQIFHLQKISTQLSKKRIADILNSESIPFEDRAIQWIAREGRGSLRDALTLLDQVIAIGGGSVYWSAVEPMVNTGHAEPIYEFLSMLMLRNSTGLLEVIARWDQEGLSMTILVEELVKACRNAFVLKALSQSSSDIDLLDLEERELESLRKIGQEAPILDLNRIFRSFVKCLDDLRNSELDRFVLENYALEWCLDPGLPDVTSLLQGGQTNGTKPQVAPTIHPAKPSSSAVLTSVANPAPVKGPDIASSVKVVASSMDLRNRWKQTSGQMPAEAKVDHQVSLAKSQAVYASGTARVESTAPETLTPRLKPAVPSNWSDTQTDPKIPTGHTITSNPTVLVPKNNETISKSLTKSNSTEQSRQGAQSMTHDFDDEELPPWFADDAEDFGVEELSIISQISAQKIVEAVVEESPISPLSVSSKWPPSWKDFVDEWKTKKPLQARVLEETYALEYSPALIKLAVESESLAGQKLLHFDTRKKLTAHFEVLFGFKGLFEVVPKSELPRQDAPHETLLETKQKVKAQARVDLRDLLENHPLTQEVLSVFGGTIESIEVQ